MATTSPAAAGTQLGPGVILKSRWKLVKKIGQGAFGEIYAGVDLEKHESIALKVEKWDNKKAVLKLEVVVLKKMQNLPDGSPNPFVCRYIHCGHYEDYNYLVMELLGENLSDLRRKRPGGRFSLATTSKLGILMLRAIESIHSLGYLHRDIKPSNFAIGLPPHRHKDCVMIDFGLTRKFRLTNGDIRPPREIAGFRGTARYASINSHLSKELSRRDDLWSLLYVLIEFATGHLPWRKLKDKEEIGLQKIQYNSPELVKGLPAIFLPFMEHLQQLEYYDEPQYDMLAELLQQLDPGGASRPVAFDWEFEVSFSSYTQNPGDRTGTDDEDRRRQFSSERALGATAAERLESSHVQYVGVSPPPKAGSQTPVRNSATKYSIGDDQDSRKRAEDSGVQMTQLAHGGGSAHSTHDPAGGSARSAQPLAQTADGQDPNFYPINPEGDQRAILTHSGLILRSKSAGKSTSQELSWSLLHCVN
mmetsp:Transcript_33862/g.79284  ORF Transcript_33862/g.79284 Transcript_33862/m.79284 type:complete len:475 (-) Transcript_33862:22-1446(-)